MNYNINTISAINKSYIHLNDNGTQERITTKVSDIKDIKPLLENELNYLNYTTNQIQLEIVVYDEKIENVNKRIESLNTIIQNGITENIPKYRRSLSNEHFEVEQQKILLNDLNNMRSGIVIMSMRIQDKKTHYQNLLKDCDIILRG